MSRLGWASSAVLLAALLACLVFAAIVCNPDSTDDPTAWARAVAIGDVDGDGVEDLAVSARFDPVTDEDRYTAWIVSGRDDTLLYRVRARRAEGPRPDRVPARFGELVEVLPLRDVDGDARPDLAVVLTAGAVCVLAGSSGAVLGRHDADLGELDFVLAAAVVDRGANGHAEVVLTAHGDRLHGEPAFALLLEAPGCTRRRKIEGPRVPDAYMREQHPYPDALESDWWGSAVADLGDLDGDGVGDLAIGASNAGSLAGRLDVVSGAIGRELYSLDGWPRQFLGSRLAPIGDQDGDGAIDLLIGLHRAAGWIVSGRDGSPIGSALPLEVVEPAGDVDGDGTTDVVGLARHVFHGGAIDPAEAIVVSGRSRESLLRIPLPAGRGHKIELGRAGDVDRDGRGDVIVVLDPLLEWQCTAGWAPRHGEVRVHSGRDGALLRSLDRDTLRALSAQDAPTIELEPAPGG